MNSPRPGLASNRQVLTITLGILLAVIMGGVLIFGFQVATNLRGQVTALQAASMLQAYPEEISQRLSTLRDRLEAHGYEGQALANLKSSVGRFNHELERLHGGGAKELPELSQAMSLWTQFSPLINPVIDFQGHPYTDTDDSSSFSKDGLKHYNAVKQAQLFTNDNAKLLQSSLTSVATALQRASSGGANDLRMLLMIGVIATFVLLVVALYFQRLRSAHEKAALEAQEQTRDILRTVREGFFLLDSDYRIGKVVSDALTRMFGRAEGEFEGLSFEELLQDLVPPATLATATKYIKLLWGERAHENLMKSINPLAQLEITAINAYGAKETRYLQFDFHRVMGPKGIKDVLCSVADITSSVLLAKELQESQENANAQLDMMLGMMHIDPAQLTAFLDTTDTGLRLINSIMKEPARVIPGPNPDAEFRKKLPNMFRELHSIKGEASALNLGSVAQRVHTLEDMVSDLKKKPEISGNDFLPLVLKLDEVNSHLRSVREMATRLTALQTSAEGIRRAATAERPALRVGPRPVEQRPAERPHEDISPTLQAMAERLAHDHQKRFRLLVNGLTEVPQPYFDTVRTCIIQMLRNAAVHGIEHSDIRRSSSKDDVGAVRIEFRRSGEAYELTFEDDGAGISPEKLKAAAVRKQLISPEDAAAMDSRAALALIFRSGLSTQDDVSMDAGRGVGMDVVHRSVQQLGGKIYLSTKSGQYTRFKIVLPAVVPSTVMAI
jgi:signal transduction histidine kinase